MRLALGVFFSFASLAIAGDHAVAHCPAGEPLVAYTQTGSGGTATITGYLMTCSGAPVRQARVVELLTRRPATPIPEVTYPVRLFVSAGGGSRLAGVDPNAMTSWMSVLTNPDGTFAVTMVDARPVGAGFADVFNHWEIGHAVSFTDGSGN